MFGWFKKLDAALAKQPATNEDLVKPVPFDWDARIAEVTAEYTERAEKILAEFRKAENQECSVEVGENAVLVVTENGATRIPFPATSLVRFWPGNESQIEEQGNRLFVTETGILFSSNQHIYEGCRLVRVPRACPHRDDVVFSDGNEYHVPLSHGRKVYEALLAKMRAAL